MYPRIQALTRSAGIGRIVPPSSFTTRSRAPATCGELVQGAIDGRDFLVNCPIDLYATASVATVDDDGLHLRSPGAWSKAVAAITRLADTHGIDLHDTLSIESPVPRGKGMASSTADISAALAAFCRHRGIDLDAPAFGELIATIEPSDCVHHPGIAEVNHLTGTLLAQWPAPAGLRVMVFDCGGNIDTVAFDRERARAIYAERRQDVARFLGLARCGLMLGDLRTIGEAATLSARVSQRILPKPPLEDLVALAASLGGCGVNCAHSGTVLGLLHPDSPSTAEVLRRAVTDAFGADLVLIGEHRVVAGGCHALD